MAEDGATAQPSNAGESGGESDDIAQMSFEAALAELETIVRQLEEGNSQLDEAIAAYERGARLKQHCEAKLREAQAKVERISLDAQGRAATQPLDSGDSGDSSGQR